MTGRSGISAFPPAGIGGFLSDLVFTLRVNTGELAGEILSYSWPAAILTVVRSDPFVYSGRAAGHRVEFPMPWGSRVPRSLAADDFARIPPGFYETGRETVWLQVLNLAARGQTDYGPARCILGETLKREYPDIFRPSFGAAQSIDSSGFPARLFISLIAVFETPFGALCVGPDTLLGCRLQKGPPVGAIPHLLAPTQLDSVADLRSRSAIRPAHPAATLLALASPILGILHSSGGQAFNTVEQAIGGRPSETL